MWKREDNQAEGGNHPACPANEARNKGLRVGADIPEVVDGFRGCLRSAWLRCCLQEERIRKLHEIETLSTWNL